MPRDVPICLVALVVVLNPLWACGDGGSSTPHDVGPPQLAAAASVGTASTTPKTSAASVASPATTTAAGATTSPSSSVAVPSTVPAGTVLRVADQYGLFQGILGFAGMDQDIPYEVEYVTLSPGPVQVQAFRADEVDLGVVSPLGLIQAAAGDVDLHAVARWHTDFAFQALVTAPGVEGITSWADLAGKRVAFQRNTMSEALVLLALDDLGMSLDDITVVDVPNSQVGTVLRGGDADVGVSSEPFVSAYLDENPTASYVLGIEEPIAQSTLVVAADGALADPALEPAVVEYLQRLDRAFTKLTNDREQFAELVVTVWHLDRDVVDRVLEGSDGVRMAAVPGEVTEPYRRLVELLAARGALPDDLDAAALFDDRFNHLFQG